MILVSLHGPPGIGKMTVGRELERITADLFIHDHLVIETAVAIFPFGQERFSELRSRLFGVLLDAACSTRRGVIVTHANDIFWKPSFESLLMGCVRAHSYEVRRVFLHCEAEEHSRRISDPSRGHYRKIGDMARLRQLVDAGEFKPFAITRDDLVIDTTSLPASEVAARIAFSLASKEGFARRVG